MPTNSTTPRINFEYSKSEIKHTSNGVFDRTNYEL